MYLNFDEIHAYLCKFIHIHVAPNIFPQILLKNKVFFPKAPFVTKTHESDIPAAWGFF